MSSVPGKFRREVTQRDSECVRRAGRGAGGRQESGAEAVTIAG